MTEYERIREEIKTKLRDFSCTCVECSYNMAIEILSLDGICIKSDDQSLSGIGGFDSDIATYEQAQQDMLNEGWVKCLKKE